MNVYFIVIFISQKAKKWIFLPN